MNARYSVHVYDPAGEYSREFCFGRFEDALAVAKQAKKVHGPAKAVRVYNDDLVDVDTDGLTTEERDQLSLAGVI